MSTSDDKPFLTKNMAHCAITAVRRAMRTPCDDEHEDTKFRIFADYILGEADVSFSEPSVAGSSSKNVVDIKPAHKD